ncbi:MAG: YhjD/YihY/BrkB family envelope integrity protein [Limisphaerales bacterium]
MLDDAKSRLKELFLGAQAAWHGHSDGVAEEAELSRPQAFIHFWALTVKSFNRNRVPVRAAALSYSSLLALVPMLALVVTIAFGFLRGDEGQKHIEDFIHYVVSAVVPSAGESADADKTVKNIQDFVKNQQTSAVSASAALVLVFIAIMMLARIEDTFNDIWGVSSGRNWFARITQYWAALTLGPVLFILVIGLTSSTQLQSVQKTLLTMPPLVGAVTDLLFQFLPFALLSIGFAVFYAVLPNTKVEWRAALVGGVVGGSLWQINNLLSVLYVSRVVANNKVYGSLGMVPVVMIGLYFSWLILLFGAQVAYSFQNRRAYFQEKQVENLDQRSREFIGLRLMVEIGRRFLAGEKPATGTALSELLGVPTRMAGKILSALVSARLLAESQQGEVAYLPARPLEQINCHDILLALRTAKNGCVATRDDGTRDRVRGHYEGFQQVEKSAAAGVTLASLAAEATVPSQPGV